MCKFFSFIGDGYGNFKYLDHEARKEILEKKSDSPDSHTFIAIYHKIPAKMQDRWSKYEYNPITKDFTVDCGIEGHNHEDARSFVEGLNFKNIAPEIIIKSIINPLSIRLHKVTEKDIALLKEWASVRNSVGDSVWNSVRNSVGASIWNSVWNSVRNSVGDSVGNSVGASVWNSVGDSVWNSVRNSVGASIWNSVWNSVRNSVGDSVGNSVGASVGNSVWNSVGAYISSFFDIKFDYDFSSVNKLYARGFVPSFDGKNWRLHSGKKAKIVWEGII